jgi:hypothetical protein
MARILYQGSCGKEVISAAFYAVFGTPAAKNARKIAYSQLFSPRLAHLESF